MLLVEATGVCSANPTAAALSAAAPCPCARSRAHPSASACLLSCSPTPYPRQQATARELTLAASRIVKSELLEPGSDVLDFGCGAGAFAEALADRAALVLGVDTSQRAIEQFQQRYVVLSSSWHSWLNLLLLVCFCAVWVDASQLAGGRFQRGRGC